VDLPAFQIFVVSRAMRFDENLICIEMHTSPISKDPHQSKNCCMRCTYAMSQKIQILTFHIYFFYSHSILPPPSISYFHAQPPSLFPPLSDFASIIFSDFIRLICIHAHLRLYLPILRRCPSSASDFIISFCLYFHFALSLM
jgi:hypothetical protein